MQGYDHIAVSCKRIEGHDKELPKLETERTEDKYHEIEQQKNSPEFIGVVSNNEDYQGGQEHLGHGEARVFETLISP